MDPAVIGAIASVFIAAITAYSAVKIAGLNKVIQTVEKNTNSLATAAAALAAKNEASAVAAATLLGEARAALEALKGELAGRAAATLEAAGRASAPLASPTGAPVPVEVTNPITIVVPPTA